MVALGDIVTVGGRPEQWAVLNFEPNALGHPKLARIGRRGGVQGSTRIDRLTFVTHPAALTVVESPSFSPGQSVRVTTGPAIVVSDDGDTVRVEIDEERQLENGDTLTVGGVSDVPKGRLVMENLV